MFGRKNEFELPELPGVCLTCGAFEPLKPVRFEYRYTTAASVLLTVLSPLVGAIFSHRMAYRPSLPVCDGCSAHLRRARGVAVLSVPLFVLTFPLAAFLVDYGLLFLFTPFAFFVAAYVYYGAVRRRGTPKVARVDKDHLSLSVPGHGELVLFERDPEAGGQARRRAAPPAPKLNRSVCDGCGFINFPNVLECKKCRAPLGRASAA